jgi:hypothetical protein
MYDLYGLEIYCVSKKQELEKEAKEQRLANALVRSANHKKLKNDILPAVCGGELDPNKIKRNCVC